MCLGNKGVHTHLYFSIVSAFKTVHREHLQLKSTMGHMLTVPQTWLSVPHTLTVRSMHVHTHPCLQEHQAQRQPYAQARPHEPRVRSPRAVTLGPRLPSVLLRSRPDGAPLCSTTGIPQVFIFN